MTTNLEKRFFETFGIKPVPIYSKLWHIRDKYPQITDGILLELIAILGSIFISVQDKETSKDHILNQCIMNKDVIKYQVQALFKEG